MTTNCKVVGQKLVAKIDRSLEHFTPSIFLDPLAREEGEAFDVALSIAPTMPRGLITLAILMRPCAHFLLELALQSTHFT